MNEPIKLLVIFSVFSLLFGCASGGNNETKAIPDLGISGGAENPDYLTMEKAALGQEFLLQSSVAQSDGQYGEFVSNPTTSGMRSRIVTFEEHGGELLMLDATGAAQPGDEITIPQLITKFPIMGSNGETITFDFNAGMKSVVLTGDWYVSDYGGEVVRPDYSLAVDSSYLKEVTNEDGAITAVQTLAVRGGGVYLIPMEVTYYLTRYQENLNYFPVVSPGFNYLGFFEANPVVEEGFGDAFTYISLWDINKPVIYYISQDVPEEYRETVREGILYWNKAFGIEVLKAEIAPEGVKAPNFKHNIIQWHTFHNTGAYADAQVDPRTGEILHAQVFLSSGLTEPLKYYGINYMDRNLRDGEDLRPAHLCSLDTSELFGNLYKYRDTVESLPPERVSSLTKDSLRWVVAHEVGHTMGLRHNFAASTINELSGKEEDELVRSYFKTGILQDDLGFLISSVMEYPNDAAMIITGAFNAKEDTPPLPYDEYAIQWAYFNPGSKLEYEGHTFCTDSQVSQYMDCLQYDAGTHLIERYAFDTRKSFEKLPRLLTEVYLFRKTAFNPMNRLSVAESTPSARWLAANVTTPFSGLLNLFSGQTLSIRRQFLGFTDVDWDELDQEMLIWLNDEIRYAGGVEEVFRIIKPEFFRETAKGFNSEFNKIIEGDNFKNIELPEGGTAGFSGGEVEYIKSRAGELFLGAEDLIAKSISLTIQSGNFSRADSIEKLEEMIAKWMGYVVTETSAVHPEPVEGSSVGGLPAFNFRYSLETRREATAIVWSRGPLPGWLGAYVPEITGILREVLERAFGKKLEEIDIRSYPREMQREIIAELSIYQALASGVGGGPVYNGSNSGAESESEPEPASESSEAVNWIGKLLD